VPAPSPARKSASTSDRASQASTPTTLIHCSKRTKKPIPNTRPATAPVLTDPRQQASVRAPAATGVSHAKPNGGNAKASATPAPRARRSRAQVGQPLRSCSLAGSGTALACGERSTTPSSSRKGHRPLAHRSWPAQPQPAHAATRRARARRPAQPGHARAERIWPSPHIRRVHLSPRSSAGRLVGAAMCRTVQRSAPDVRAWTITAHATRRWPLVSRPSNAQTERSAHPSDRPRGAKATRPEALSTGRRTAPWPPHRVKSRSVVHGTRNVDGSCARQSQVWLACEC